MPVKNKKGKIVSVIIPAYKQEKTIVEDVTRVYETMSQTRWPFEIIVVVDGFVDDTFEKVKKIENLEIKVFGYEINKGKGYAVRYGMARASGDYIAFIDSGMDIDPNGISMLLEHAEWYDADIIVGSKRHPASKLEYPFIRRIYSWGYSKFVKFLFGLKLTDTQSGLKVFKREVLDMVLPRLVVKKFAFDIEILAVSKYLGFDKIFEAPIKINWIKFNTSFTPFLVFDKNIRNMIMDTLGVFYRLAIMHYYDDKKKRLWIYDKDLDMRVNTGKLKND